jgi:hypothetical protein
MPYAVAAKAVGSHVAGYQARGMSSGHPQQVIIMLLAGSAVLVFVQHARSNTPQSGRQFIAIGIVGFLLLFVSEFASDIALAFATLFFIAILLNSPKGIPVVSESAKKGK